jgi:hypothetical protein
MEDPRESQNSPSQYLFFIIQYILELFDHQQDQDL